MTLCSTEVVRRVAKYLGATPGAIFLTSDKVVTTAFGKETVSGFASVLMRLAQLSRPDGGANPGHAQACLDYQWLEYAASYADHAGSNPAFANKFLQEINSALELNSYLTGQQLSVADIALCLTLSPLLEKLSWTERNQLQALCRWNRHVNARVTSPGA